jgi:hypothetical protein
MTTAILCCLLVIACLVAVQTGILLLLCAKAAWGECAELTCAIVEPPPPSPALRLVAKIDEGQS